MSAIAKPEVLRIFKALHRACQKTFRNDDEVLNGMKKGINDCFKVNKTETDQNVIRKLYSNAVEIENEIRTKILQLEEVRPGYHKMTIEPEHCFKDPPKKKRCCDGHEHEKHSGESKSEAGQT